MGLEKVEEQAPGGHHAAGAQDHERDDKIIQKRQQASNDENIAHKKKDAQQDCAQGIDPKIMTPNVWPGHEQEQKPEGGQDGQRGDAEADGKQKQRIALATETAPGSLDFRAVVKHVVQEHEFTAATGPSHNQCDRQDDDRHPDPR